MHAGVASRALLLTLSKAVETGELETGEEQRWVDVDAVFHFGGQMNQTNLQINASVRKCDLCRP